MPKIQIVRGDKRSIEGKRLKQRTDLFRIFQLSSLWTTILPRYVQRTDLWNDGLWRYFVIRICHVANKEERVEFKRIGNGIRDTYVRRWSFLLTFVSHELRFRTFFTFLSKTVAYPTRISTLPEWKVTRARVDLARSNRFKT